jgi:hypothetical protein
LPTPLSPCTVTFQPEPVPVESVTVQLDICAVAVCDWPFNVTWANAGMSGAASKLSEPASTENWLVSAAAWAEAAGSATTSKASALAHRTARPSLLVNMLLLELTPTRFRCSHGVMILHHEHRPSAAARPYLNVSKCPST